MPWWGWLIIAAVIVIGLPVKLKLLKKINDSKKRQDVDDI